MVIDGQQRLTALLASMYAIKIRDKNFKERNIKIAFNPLTKEFAVWSQAYERDPEWISEISSVFLSEQEHMISKFRKNFIKELNDSRQKKQLPILTEDEEDLIENNINALLDLNIYSLPTLKINSDANEEDVADIFVRVNSGGQTLTEKNFIETLLAVYDNEIHDKISKFCEESRIPINGTSYNQLIEVDPSHLIRMAVGIGFKRARLRYAYMLLRGKDLKTKEVTSEVREKNLTTFRNGIEIVCDLNNWHAFLNIFASAGYLRGNIIASQNAVVFSYILYLIGKYEYKVNSMDLQKIIRKWIFMATLTAYYSFSTETTVEKQFADLRDVKNSRTATLKLDPTIFGAGVYTVTLSIRDNANNSNISNRTFTFEIVNEELTNSRPTVTFGNTTIGNVTSEQKISIPVPTISDSNDTRMLIKYYVEIGDRYIEVNTDEDGKNIVFNMNDPVATTVGGELDSTIYKLVTTSSSRSFNVVAVAYNDFADYDVIDFENYNEKNERYDGIGLGRYSISIKYEEDKVAPKFDITSIGNINIGAFDQYSWVEVQGVTFYDNTDTARIYATVTDTKGNVYDYEDLKGAMTVTYEGGEYKYTFGGIKFKANNADDGNFYTVTYTLVDNGNNVVSYSFVLVQATDKTAPVISGIDGTEMTLELGRTLYFTGLTATDNASSLDDGTITFDISVRNSEGRYFSQICRYINGQLVFSPEEEGVYTISIIAKDAENNTSDERTIQVTVEDTIKPVISLIDSNTDQIIINENEITEDAENNTVYPSVSIPRFIVEDVGPTDANPNVSYSATGSITITTPKRDSNNANEYTYDMDGTLITEGVDNVLNFTASGNAFTFTPTARGEYTITYNGTDNSGNEAEEITIIVNVGDTENPEIILTNSFNTLLNNGFTLGENDTLVINPNARIYDDAGYNSEDIYVRDNAGFEYEVDDNNDDIEENDIHYVPVTITITDPSGDAVTRDDSDDSLYHYTFTEQGTYTISFTVTDEVGNRETYSRTFVVRAKPSSTIDTTTILGTVLIVVSAVILAGVIVYFVKGTKQLPKKSKESNKKNNNKNEIDK